MWPRLHAALLSELHRAGLLDLDDSAVDGSHVWALATRHRSLRPARIPRHVPMIIEPVHAMVSRKSVAVTFASVGP